MSSSISTDPAVLSSHDKARWVEKEYVLHSWSAQSQYQAPTIIGGEGSTFWDMDGKRYLDFSSQAMCNNLGHHKVVEAIKRQADQLCFVQCAWGSLPRAQLAERLHQIAPSNLSKTFFTNAGAEANENAIKFARWFTGKQKIISRYRSYHGASAGAMALSGDPRRWATEPLIPGLVRALDPYCYRCSFGLEYPSCNLRCAEHIDELIMLEGPEHVAAVVIEPVVGSNGILVPPDGYMQRLREICTDNDVLLICDEVMTGFGRTGAWFASEHWDIKPDILVLAKGLTGAMVPLGAVMISQEIADHFADKVLVAGLTYLGHPLACAAGVAALEAYQEEGLIDRSRVLGERMLQRLNLVQEHHPSVGEVRGIGLFAAVELVKDRDTREPFTPFNTSSPVIGRIVKEARDRGVSIAARWNFFMLAPPLVITEPELDRALNLLDELLAYADAEVEH